MSEIKITKLTINFKGVDLKLTPDEAVELIGKLNSAFGLGYSRMTITTGTNIYPYINATAAQYSTNEGRSE